MSCVPKACAFTRQDAAITNANKGCGGTTYVEEQPHAAVAAAVASLERQGLPFRSQPLLGNGPVAWLGVFRDWRLQKQNGVAFCADAALTGCLANKSGLRAAAVLTARQAGRALASVGADALIVEMPGPTFFEVRQILSAAAGSTRACPWRSTKSSRSWTPMRIAEVIGTVTLSRAHAAVTGLRWIIGVPFSLKALQEQIAPDGEDVIIVDQLGAGCGQKIGFSEGGEAAAPFVPDKMPVDAYCACILDAVEISG